MSCISVQDGKKRVAFCDTMRLTWIGQNRQWMGPLGDSKRQKRVFRFWHTVDRFAESAQRVC